MMSMYQEAILRAAVSHKGERGEFRTIPEELYAIHPRQLHKEMQQIFDDCEFVQKKVLEEILSLGCDSVYGKDHGFNKATDPECWRNKAGISVYDDYKPYIDAEMHLEQGQLFCGDTALYIATTGSTSEMKYFVESKAGDLAKQLVMAIRGMYMSEILPVTLDMEAKNLTISNYAAMSNNLDGKLILRASGQTARNMRKKTGTMNILPVDFWEAPGLSARDRDYMICVYALAEVRLSKIFCNNLIHFGRLLDRVATEGKLMIEDIRRGYFSVPLTEEVRSSLAHTLIADDKRAEELQKIYERNNCLMKGRDSVEAIWPALSMVGCWLSAGVGRDAREVLRRLPPKVKCFDLGYGASEGKLNIPTRLACPSGAAVPFGCFYEFLPLDGGKPICMWEVEDGKYYELLITTYSGLYRYNLQDIVRIDGFTGKTPNIEFCGKSSDYLIIGNQKIFGYKINEMVHGVEKILDIDLCLVQAFTKDNIFYYVFESEEDFDVGRLKLELDRKTIAAFGFPSGGIYIMERGYKDHLFTERTRDDRGACGIKLPVILDKEPLSRVEKLVY